MANFKIKQVAIYFIDEMNCTFDEPEGDNFYIKIKIPDYPKEINYKTALTIISNNEFLDGIDKIIFDTCGLNKYQNEMVSLLYVDFVCQFTHIKYEVISFSLRQEIQHLVNGYKNNWIGKNESVKD